MAEFQTFDLGRVFQTAEAINSLRRQSTTDALQQRYLQQRITAGEEDQAAQQQTRKMQIDAAKAKEGWTQIQYAKQSGNPRQFLLSNPAFVQNMESKGIPVSQMDEAAFTQFISGLEGDLGTAAGIAPQAKWEEVRDESGALLQRNPQTGEIKQVVAPTKPAGAPSSFEEYTRAQKDPEYRKFLESRRGKGFSMTLPDGTVVEMGGSGSGVGPGELTKPTVNALQETIVKNTDRLDRVNQLMTAYKPEYLQAKGLIKAGTTEAKDFLGMDVSEEDKKFLAGYSEFRANAVQEFSATLKDLSGTAASDREVARIIKGVPSENDRSPTAFEGKARATTKAITRIIMRSNWALKNGIGVGSVEELSKRMPLEGIDGVYEARANQIWQEMGGTPETKQQAIQQANQEFGLAR